MSGFLLDTNVVILAVTTPARLSTSVLSTLEAGNTCISVVSYWEIVLKSMKGNLDIGSPEVWWTIALQQLQASVLTIRQDDVSALLSLPPIHQDPFDRMLLAQAQISARTLVTTDTRLTQYERYNIAVLV